MTASIGGRLRRARIVGAMGVLPALAGGPLGRRSSTVPAGGGAAAVGRALRLPGLRLPYDAALRSADELLECRDALDGERWAVALWTTILDG